VNQPVILLKGADPVLLGDALSGLLDEVLGDGDRTERVDEFAGDDYDLGSAVMAANSVSMFGDRIVVARNGGRFAAADIAPIVAYLDDPNPTSTLVLVWDKPVASGASNHSVPKKLADAIKAAGGVVRDTDAPGQAKARRTWLDARLAEADVRLDAAAKALVAERLGEDVGRVGSLVAVLESSFPATATVGVDDVAPFLGDAGSVPPWDLTDAIDRGDVTMAIDKLHRMTRAGERHPLQIMAILQSHFERMLRLDGAGVRTEAEAAALLGMKGSTFPAKKAMESARRMGSERIASAIRLLAGADADLRGASAQAPELVMEVLVGRLARLSGRR
jgi:DNA polymerase-3 subunit delta